jgi:tetratricopeptide (TPR) repeat protein
MAEPFDAVRELLALADAWTARLDSLSGCDLNRMESLLDEAMQDAPADSPSMVVRPAFEALARHASAAERVATSFVRRIDVADRLWRRTRRYTEAGLAELFAELRTQLQTRPRTGARRWLEELLVAIEAAQVSAARVIAEASLPFPEELADGAAAIRDVLAIEPDEVPSEFLALVADGRIDGWRRVLRDELRATAQRLSAWAVVRTTGDLEAGRRLLDAAIVRDPTDARGYVERTALHRLLNDQTGAMRDAERVVELIPDEARGYSLLGLCAEDDGDYESADHFYEEALHRATAAEIEAAGRGATLARPSGRLLLRAGQWLDRRGRSEAAVAALRRALEEGVAGPERYADAEAYRSLSHVLEKLPEPPRDDVADAAYEAAKRLLWNQDAVAAIDELDRALTWGCDARDLGWILADALLVRADRPGEFPDLEISEQARAVWDSWTNDVGPPDADSSWAYVTRSRITSSLTNQPERNLHFAAGEWDGLGWLERAVILDDSDWYRWSGIAACLRNLDMPWLAFEAVERASALDPTAPDVLEERQAGLANLGRLDEAAAAGEELMARHGRSAWVNGIQADILFRLDRPADAIELLEEARAEAFDPGWFRPLRALCELQLGEVGAAKDTMRDELERRGTTAPSSLATAALVLGDVDRAQRLLEDAKSDPMVREDAMTAARALLAYARDDLPEAESLVERQLRNSVNAQELQDTVKECLLLIRALGGNATTRERSARAVAARVAPEVEAALAASGRNADQELGSLLDDLAHGRREDAIESSLDIALAIQGRRLTQDGSWAEAVDTYAKMIGGWLDPEAAFALARALRALRDERADNGDIEGVDAVERRLAELDVDDPVEAVLAAAQALCQAGRLGEAKARVLSVIEQASDAAIVPMLRITLGKLAVCESALDEAKEWFETAIAASEHADLKAWSAQSLVWLALIADTAGSREAVEAYLQAALDAWREAGSFDPEWALMDQLLEMAHDPAGKLLREQGKGIFDDALEASASA